MRLDSDANRAVTQDWRGGWIPPYPAVAPSRLPGGSMSFPLEPWQPRAVAKMVRLGCDEERAKRIAASIESQVRISADDWADLFKALDGEETADAAG